MSSGSSVEDQSLAIEDQEGFLADYYQHMAEEDARSYRQDVLATRAETHRKVAASRLPGQAKVAIVTEADFLHFDAAIGCAAEEVRGVRVEQIILIPAGRRV